MFWSAKYVAVRQLNFLLKEENVSLAQVLEADDILQECKADNKALIQFLTKPEILAELVSLIIEEPPAHVELAYQYRHASIACEVLTSQLVTLSDRLSLDTAQMHRLCNFVCTEPPLNPLLASYFCKTIEMLLERNPKQDWYLYHIVCLRVLDFFKVRSDFLPGLLRHLATSAVADTFKAFIRLEDLFNKIVMEWLDEHQFLESLIQIICGTYAAEPLAPRGAPRGAGPAAGAPGPTAPAAESPEATTPDGHAPEKCERELSEKADFNHKEGVVVDDNAKAQEVLSSAGQQPNNAEQQNHAAADENANAPAAEPRADADAEVRAGRMRAVASANASGLLCDLVFDGCAGEGCASRPRTAWVLVARLQEETAVSRLLQAVFTSPAAARRHALVHGCRVLLALLAHEPAPAGEVERSSNCSVELAVAPHLPLLHTALLHAPNNYTTANGHTHTTSAAGNAPEAVGAARVQVAALLAQLALSEVPEVATTMLTLGTPGALIEMFFRFPHNNFLHAQVCALLRNALANRVYRQQYLENLVLECDLLTRLMDIFEENEARTPCPAGGGGAAPRSACLGHVVLCLGELARALPPDDCALLPAALAQRWQQFVQQALQPRLLRHDSPLGGCYPSDNVYEVETMDMADNMEAVYEFPEAAPAPAGALDDVREVSTDTALATVKFCGTGDVDQLSDDNDDLVKQSAARSSFLELASERFDDNLWDDAPEPELPEPDGDSQFNVSPWEASGSCADDAAGDNWAQFSSDAFGPPADPFAPPPPPSAAPSAPPPPPAAPFDDFEDFEKQEFSPFWSSRQGDETTEDASARALERDMPELRLRDAAEPCALAHHLLTAMSGLAPDLVANIVNANMAAQPPATPPPHPPSPPASPPHPPSPPASPPPDGTDSQS